MHAFIWQRAHHVDAVAYQYLVELAHKRFQRVGVVQNSAKTGTPFRRQRSARASQGSAYPSCFTR
ncbi:hypothetical protein ALQ91_101239 [Pseudomonas syringae pv. syringae]|nr:hypothetical protein ALQ91_101239 [Pseudomonas syringae pv. syringae]